MSNRDKRRRPAHGLPADAAEPVGYRHARLQELIGSELASLLRDEVADPTLAGMRLTLCELSIDYSSVRAWFTIPGPLDRERRRRVAAGLDRASGFLRGRLAAAIDLRQTPRLRFIHDDAAMDEAPAE